ncbi:hypothetical protein ACSS6W_005368 [Trichoderma asperelloides]|nr:hypothetical protein LI328DRAFT_47185 [Trichoderma asperelloides]
MVDTSDIQYIERTKTANQSSNGEATPDASDKPIKLGDFSKLFSEFLNPAPHRNDSASGLSEDSSYNEDESFPRSLISPQASRLPPSASEHASEQSVHDTSRTIRAQDASAHQPQPNIIRYNLRRDVQSIFANGHSTSVPYEPESSSSSSSFSAASTAVEHGASCQTSICGKGHRVVEQSVFLTSSHAEGPECLPQSKIDKFASRMGRELSLIEEKHQSLMMGLVPYRVRDAVMAEKHPGITSQGIHVFVDMSNIDIGYQTTLKESRSIHKSSRLSPLPHLNLQLLTKILIRDRPVAALNVCCSTLPGRSEPRYVQQLRELGYHIDLRERKRVNDGLFSAKTPETLRYVEDLVDETLQVRIAESVMEHFLKPGTIVLATGDAKPSVHSDGFFSYMQRALRMGWNVEVVSWRGSLSLKWTDRQWTSQWNGKFRVIELDEFLEILK